MAFAFPLFPFVCSIAPLPKQAISLNIWQKHDKQSISSEHQPTQPPQSQDALCQLLLYTGTRTVSELFKHFSKPTIFQGASAANPWWKMLSCDVKGVDEGRIYAPPDSALFWLMVHLSPSFFVQRTLRQMTGNPAVNLVCSRQKKKNLNFTEV